jgi:hypothetical protein
MTLGTISSALKHDRFHVDGSARNVAEGRSSLFFALVME